MDSSTSSIYSSIVYRYIKYHSHKVRRGLELLNFILNADVATMNPSPSKLVHLWDSVQRIITESAEESKLTAEHENLIREQYNQLLNHLTSVSDIAAHMFQDGKLTTKELEHIQQFDSTPIRASEELLNIIMRNSCDVYECFLQSLKKTNQHHVYQMLTASVQQSHQSGEYSTVHAGDDFASEHSRLIRQNYAWLTESLDPDNGLLTLLLEEKVLSGREYEKINSWKDKFKKNEILLCLISRKSIFDFKHFQDALNETLQPEINQKLTKAAAVKDAKSEHKLRTVKTKRESCARSSAKRIPPKIPPKPKRQLPVTVAQLQPLQKPAAQPTNPSCFESVAVNHHRTTQHDVNKRQVFNLVTQFKKLQNELQPEVSTKITLLRHKTVKDNIWKICVEKILQESHKVKSQSQNKAKEENWEKLRQEILEEKCKFITFRNEIQRENSRTEKELRALQEKEYHLENSLKSKINDNEKLSRRLEESQLMLDKPNASNQQKEQRAAENEKLFSIQLNESIDKLRLSDTDIHKLYQREKELENKVRKYMELEEQHHRENSEIKERNEALSTELALAECRLKELDQETFYEQKLKEAGSRLRETEKKVEETELELKLRLRETEEKLKTTETKLQVTEVKLTETQAWAEEFRAEGCGAKILDLEQKQEEKRNAWLKEKEQLNNQIQEQRRLIVELQDRAKYLSDPVLVQTMRIKAPEKKNKSIRGVTILDKELFVVIEDSPEVEVYDSMQLSKSRRLILKELIHPNDLGSCNRNKCLYIFNFQTSNQSMEILRVDPNGNIIKKWLTGDNVGHLSVTDESNVIFTVYHKNKLSEYSPDGQLLREIKFAKDSGIRYLWHAIKLTNGHFLVSHGWSEDDLHRVCVVDGDGKLKKSVGGKLGSTIEQMNHPLYLAVDRNGFVMVADSGNSRVLLLNSDLEFKREILSKEKHGLEEAWMILDQTNNRLFVANNEWDAEKEVYKNARILICEFR